LSEALGTLIANPELRATLGSGGKIRADYLCNPRRQINKLYDILSEIVRQEAKL
jgi:hypothetical protein